MKTFAKIALICFLSSLVSAQEYSISFDKIETQNKFIPAISFLIRPKLLQRFNFMIAYANNFAIATNPTIQDRRVANFHMALTYRF